MKQQVSHWDALDQLWTSLICIKGGMEGFGTQCLISHHILAHSPI
jgi:hypothetical protein